MAGRGPQPNAHHQRERDTRRRVTARQTVVTRDGRTRGPELAGEYGPETLAWYETWRHAPQAALFEATDWSRLAMLAAMVDAYHRRPSAAALSEIRLSEERLGATVVDRQRARIVVEDADDAQDADVVSLADVRAELRQRMRDGL